MCLWKFTSTRLAWLGFSATDSALSTGHGSRSVATDCSEWRHSPPGIYRPETAPAVSCVPLSNRRQAVMGMIECSTLDVAE